MVERHDLSGGEPQAMPGCAGHGYQCHSKGTGIPVVQREGNLKPISRA
jgi:hypothetical protein